jgi:glyoxylase-like metal-dependent hydrolase (beta-lactamase superfamily II)
MQFEFGQPVADGDSFHIGHIRLDVLETPGHTLEHISLSLTDTACGEGPVAVFTGDTLFIADVGRTDFYPDRFATAIDDGLQVLDVRSPESYAGAHIPGSLAIPLKMLPTFAGWYLNYRPGQGNPDIG